VSTKNLNKKVRNVVKLSVPMFQHPKSSIIGLTRFILVYIISLIISFLPKTLTNSPSHFQKFIPLSPQSNNNVMTKQKLSDMYYTQRMTLQQIGDVFGVTRERVRQVMEKYNLPRNTKRGGKRVWEVKG